MILTFQQWQDPPPIFQNENVGITTTNPNFQQVIVNITNRITGFHNFPLSNFKYFLTLFSKFFSSFAHATCSLSVSRQYLALDEIYHPFWAAIPSNSTLWTAIVRGEHSVKDRIFTFYDLQFQRSYTEVTRRLQVSRLQLGGPFGNPIYRLSYSRFTRRY